VPLEPRRRVGDGDKSRDVGPLDRSRSPSPTFTTHGAVAAAVQAAHSRVEGARRGAAAAPFQAFSPSAFVSAAHASKGPLSSFLYQDDDMVSSYAGSAFGSSNAGPSAYANGDGPTSYHAASLQLRGGSSHNRHG